MSDLLQHLVNALSLGGFYSMFALGIALLFGIMRLVNLAFGELIMIGGYAVVLVALPFPVAVCLAIAIVILCALLTERFAFRPIRKAEPETMLITSFAVSYMLQNLAIVMIGSTPQSRRLPGFLSQSVAVGPLTAPLLQFITIGITALSLGLLALFLQRTGLGIAMRATAENFQMARLLGVRANVVIATAFALSGALAALGAVLLVAQTGTVYPTIGLSPLIVAFVATIIGGIGSLRGAVMGGFLLAILSVGLQAYLPAELRSYRDAFLYAGVLLLLNLRPHGIVTPTARARIV